MESDKPVADRIKERAYALWEQEGCPDGRAYEFWERARQDIEGCAETAPQVVPSSVL